MSTLTVHRPHSRCQRAAGATSVVLLWFLLAPVALLIAISLIGTIFTVLIPTDFGSALLVPVALLAYGGIFVVAAPLVPMLLLSLGVAIAAAHADAMPQRGVGALGTASSAIGAGIVTFLVLVVVLSFRI